MKKSISGSVLTIIASSILLSCGGSGAKDKKGDLGDLKVKLEKLKKDKAKTESEIRKIEADIAKLDTNAAVATKLVAIDTVRTDTFSHYIEIQGKIDAEGMAYVAPKGPGGLVKAIYVKAGQRVGKGQMILKLDDAMARQAVASAQQQTGVLKARLTQAETIYERHLNLWKQNIGAEINVINAKADVDALQSQLKAAQAQVSMAQEQANMSNVTAEISGIVDVVNIKVGEFFSPQSAAMPQSGIRIVNNTSLKVVANVPENYIRSVKKGFPVVVDVPQSDTSFHSIINAVGASIDPITRSFNAEARVPTTSTLKPNQIATMKILDKKVMDAIKISVNLVQPDENGRFVYVVENNGGKLIARKRQVEVGETYNGEILIKNGLHAGDVIITEGYQTVYDGQSISAGK